MRPRLRSTLSLSRDSPHPSQESAREYSTMVNTSCSAMVRFSNLTRSTEPSEETTVARSSLLPTASERRVAFPSAAPAPCASPNRMLVPPDDMSIVSPATSRPSASLAITGVTMLMRTVVRSCLISRATAVVTPRITTLKKHQITFMITVPGRSRSQMKIARNGDQNARQVEDQQDQKRLRDLGIEECALHHSALCRHVELAQLRIDQRHHRGQQNVRRQNRLVDFIPERVPVLALDARVGHVRKNQVRQRVCQNRGPVARHVRVSQHQVDQRRAQKDQSRNRVQKVHIALK